MHNHSPLKSSLGNFSSFSGVSKLSWSVHKMILIRKMALFFGGGQEQDLFSLRKDMHNPSPLKSFLSNFSCFSGVSKLSWSTHGSLFRGLFNYSESALKMSSFLKMSPNLFLWQEVQKQRLVKFLKMVYVKTELTRLMTNLFTSLLKVVADTDKRVRYPSSQDCFQNDFLTEWSWFKIILDPHCGMRIAPYSRLTLKTGRSETATRQIKQELQRGNSWRLKSKNIINEANDKPDDYSLEVDTDKTLLPSSLCHSDPSLHPTRTCQRKIS